MKHAKQGKLVVKNKDVFNLNELDVITSYNGRFKMDVIYEDKIVTALESQNLNYLNNKFLEWLEKPYESKTLRGLRLGCEGTE